MSDRPRDPRFDAAWEALALDGTLRVAPDATITPRTFAWLRDHADTADLAPRGTAPDPPTTPALETLPHISLRLAAEEGTPAMVTGRVPDLVLGEILGQGGMGRVYLARQRSLGREVAVKTLQPHADAGAHEALVSEAVLVGALEHPGIVPVHALGVDDQGRPILVMKRVEGVAWRTLLADQSHPAWAPWDARAGSRLLANLEIVSQLCDALQFAHGRGVIHRDVKPENVMLGTYCEVYLVDWGVAMRTGASGAAPTVSLVGTPAYMAPEMASGGTIDARTDVYLLGATLHEALTGRPRHEGATLRDVLRAAWDSEPARYPAHVPEELAALCNRATDRDPARRPASPAELRRAIAEYLRRRASIALSDAAQERLGELRAVLADAPQAERERVLSRAGALAAETKFGFTQALAQCDTNEAAARGLRACRESVVEIEVLRGDARAARALLGELHGPPADLEERVAALEGRVRDEARTRERLAQFAADHDPGVGQQERRRGLLWLALVTVVITIAIFALQYSGRLLTHRELVTFAAVLLATAIGVIGARRRQLLTNEFNRRTVALVLIVLAGLLATRLLGWGLGLGTPAQLAFDSLMIAIPLAVGAITVLRWIAWCSALLVATSVAIALLPQYASFLFVGGGVSTVLLALVFWRRTR